MTNISTTDRSLSLREGRSLPDEAIFSNVTVDCFAPAGLAGHPLPDEAIFSNVSVDCFAPAGLAMTIGAMTKKGGVL